jgi:hypothetical protein
MSNELSYAEKWETPVGADCIDLCSNLARWLGPRLVHLGTHTRGTPLSYIADDSEEELAKAHTVWTGDLIKHGNALIVYADDQREGADDPDVYAKATEALRWAADNLGSLWD